MYLCVFSAILSYGVCRGVGVHTPQLSSGWKVGMSRRRLVLPRKLQGAGKVGARPSAVSTERLNEYFVELRQTFFSRFVLHRRRLLARVAYLPIPSSKGTLV